MAEQPAAVRILHVEDVESDCELVARSLVEHGIRCEIVRVERAAEFRAALASGGFDIVLSDHALPGWSGLDALDWVSERWPDLPFVFVSGSIGEDVAIDMLKRGATDYVLKERLSRLAPAVTRALGQAEERKRRRQAEQALRESHRFVQRILDSSPSLFYVYEVETGRLVYVAGRLGLLGYSVDGLHAAAGAGMYGLIHDEDQARVREQRARLAGAAPERVMEVELRARHADGSWRSLHCREVAFAGGDGATPQVLGVAQDVTERKAAEAQLLRTQRLESIGALAGGIAHDLNNVLSPILMSVEILRRRLPPDDSRTLPLLARIEGSALRGAEMVKQILHFARGREGERSALDLRDLVDDVVRLARETFPRSIEVLYERPSQPARARGDATQLHQVLLNLCVNARDAMPGGGTLALSLAARERTSAGGEGAPSGWLRLSIADTGTGIPGSLRERIFEPFFTTKAVGEGTGLGLSTSLAIVKSHGGALEVESEPGRGATFHIDLPAADGSAVGTSAPSLADVPAGRGELVLVVDDEEMIRDLARELLEASGYRVLCARNGKEALATLAAAGPVDVVVTDLSMPVMDGVALAATLRDAHAGARIILTTGQEQPAENLPQPLLRKPFTLLELLTALRRALDA